MAEILNIEDELTKRKLIEKKPNERAQNTGTYVRFSERNGQQNSQEILTKTEMSDSLCNRLWNVLYNIFFLNNCFIVDIWGDSPDIDSPLDVTITHKIYDKFKKQRISALQGDYTNRDVERDFIAWEWDIRFDFIEFLCIEFNKDIVKSNLIKRLNTVLTQENSAYRILDNGAVVDISSELENQSLNSALVQTDKFITVNKHLERAVKLYADRKNPDYSNSIKESIHAVESMAKLILNEEKDSFGALMAKLQTQYNVPKSLANAFTKIYGYTSNEDGIRHPISENGELASAKNAKFMLVTCSAFINYLIETCEVNKNSAC